MLEDLVGQVLAGHNAASKGIGFPDEARLTSCLAPRCCGDVMAWAREYADATGHAMIFVGDVSIVEADPYEEGTSPGDSLDSTLKAYRDDAGAIGASGGEGGVYRSDEYLKEHKYDPDDAQYRRVKDD